jgi:hypothetical protein
MKGSYDSNLKPKKWKKKKKEKLKKMQEKWVSCTVQDICINFFGISEMLMILQKVIVHNLVRFSFVYTFPSRYIYFTHCIYNMKSAKCNPSGLSSSFNSRTHLTDLDKIW